MWALLEFITSFFIILLIAVAACFSLYLIYHTVKKFICWTIEVFKHEE